MSEYRLDISVSTPILTTSSVTCARAGRVPAEPTTIRPSATAATTERFISRFPQLVIARDYRPAARRGEMWRIAPRPAGPSAVGSRRGLGRPQAAPAGGAPGTGFTGFSLGRQRPR